MIIKSDYIEEEDDASSETKKINNKRTNKHRTIMDRELKNLDITMNDMPMRTINVYNTSSKSKEAEKVFYIDDSIDDYSSVGSCYMGETVPNEFTCYNTVKSG